MKKKQLRSWRCWNIINETLDGGWGGYVIINSRTTALTSTLYGFWKSFWWVEPQWQAPLAWPFEEKVGHGEVKMALTAPQLMPSSKRWPYKSKMNFFTCEHISWCATIYGTCCVEHSCRIKMSTLLRVFVQYVLTDTTLRQATVNSILDHLCRGSPPFSDIHRSTLPDICLGLYVGRAPWIHLRPNNSGPRTATIAWELGELEVARP